MSRVGLLVTLLATYIVLLVMAAAGRAASPPYPQATSSLTAYPVLDITFTSTWDGSEQRASLALPTLALDSPAPLVLYAHGSINCADKSPHHAAAADAALGQAVAARGWIFAAAELHGERSLTQGPDDIGVWCPDVSVGYRPLGARPAQYDMLDLLNYVRQQYPVDPERVYLLAHSAGGLTALPLLARYPDLFAAAVVYWSPTDLAVWHDERFNAGDFFQAKNIRREVGGFPAEVPYNYARRSPITFARNLTHVPLALVHGRQDTKVPFHHSENLVDAIRGYDATADVTLYAFDGGHSDPNTPYNITWALDWLASRARPSPPDSLALIVDTGGTPGTPGEPELGPFDHFWWLGWTPAPGPSRWTQVAFTRTSPLEVSGVVSDSAGITLTLRVDRLGWPDAPARADIHPPTPTPAFQVTLVPISQTLSLPLPAGMVSVRVQAATPTPTPTPTPRVGSIQGLVFHDLNENGVPELGEPGLEGVTVHLRQGGSLLATQVTAAGGVFTFTNLLPGTYIVEEVNPPGYRDTTWNVQQVVVQAGKIATVYFGDRLVIRKTWLPIVRE